MTPRVLFFILLTVILWGTTPVLEKIGLRQTDPLIGVTIRSIAVTIALLGYVVIAGRFKDLIHADGRTLAIFSVTGILAGLLGMLAYFFALKNAPASKVVPIAATYPLIAAVLSFLILGEHVTPIRFFGTILIVFGIWLVQI